MDGLEVGFELFSGVEAPVGEVHGQDAVHVGGVAGFEDIAVEGVDAGLLVWGEFGDMVFVSPVEGGLVDVEAESLVGGSAADPFAAGVGGATEVFTHDCGAFAAEFLVDSVDEINLGFDILDGAFVEVVLAGGLGGEFALLLFLWLLAHGAESVAGIGRWRGVVSGSG